MAKLGAVLCAICLLAASCGSGSTERQLSVFAAASLTDVMAELSDAFEAANPDVEVALNYAGSTAIRAQLIEGGPADVVLLANEPVMRQLLDAEVVDHYEIVAANRMVLAVPIGNPGGVEALADLVDESLLIGLCDQDVPCGATARIILDAAELSVSPDTNEPDVRSLLAKIVSGELDAGIVYSTDLASSQSTVVGFEIDPSLYEPNVYPVAVVDGASNESDGRLFVQFVLSPVGQSILMTHGFLPPSAGPSQ